MPAGILSFAARVICSMTKPFSLPVVPPGDHALKRKSIIQEDFRRNWAPRFLQTSKCIRCNQPKKSIHNWL